MALQIGLKKKILWLPLKGPLVPCSPPHCVLFPKATHIMKVKESLFPKSNTLSFLPINGSFGTNQKEETEQIKFPSSLACNFY